MAYVRPGNSQLKHQIMKNSTLVHQGSKAIYQICTKNTVISGDIRKCQLGTAKNGLKEKVIMIVGKTGTGKTTMINAMFNYVVDVKFEDPFRFRLVDESVQSQTLTQADSQTNDITAYTLHHQDGFAVPYTLTIIDTPGFGDTRGKEQDKKLIEQIRLFFTTAGNAGIRHIDAVGFVVKATDARLTENEKYIFNSVLSLWGNNIKGNIFIFFSFSDNKTAAALGALDSAKIPYEQEKCYKFNNSALFGNEESGDDDDDLFAEIYSKMKSNSFHKFLIEHLTRAESKSLTLSEAVLKLRKMLEINQEGNTKDIENIIVKQEMLNDQLAVLENHRISICKTANKEDEKIENLKAEQKKLKAELADLENLITKIQQNTPENIENIHELEQQLDELGRHSSIYHGANIDGTLKKGIARLAALNEQMRDLMNSSFTRTEIIQELKMIPVRDKRAINCRECKRTCHYPCRAIGFAYICSIFNLIRECSVCHCSSGVHHIQDYEYRLERKTIKKNDEVLRRHNEIRIEELRSEIFETEREIERVSEIQKEETEWKGNLIQKAAETATKLKEKKDAVECAKQRKENLRWKAVETATKLKEKIDAVEIAKQRKDMIMKSLNSEQQKLQKNAEDIKKRLETDEKKMFGQVMVRRFLNETLQEIALKSEKETAGWKECDYIKQMIQTEKNEGKQGWRNRTQQLQELQQKSEKLSIEWNTVFDQIHPEYICDLKLSREDNEKYKKVLKIIEFKKKVHLFN